MDIVRRQTYQGFLSKTGSTETGETDSEKSTKQDEDGFVTALKPRASWSNAIVAVACISGFTGLGEDKPVEIDWETDFQTPAEAYGKTKKPAITSVWGDMEEDMDYNEKITWD